MTPNLDIKPDIKISVNQSFGLNTDMLVDGFSKKNEHVPEIDKDYKFDRDTTLAILSGFAFNKRVLIQGYHGTGKSTHIEQVAAKLNWPCIRVNLDSHISRIDLIGKDVIINPMPATPGSPERRLPSINKAKKSITYVKKYPLEKGLKETFAWYDKNVFTGKEISAI